MQYRVIGLMSGSSLDGLDIVYAEFDESGGKWNYEIKAAACIEYSNEWVQKLKNAPGLNAYEYCLLHSAYGKFIGQKVNEFIEANNLHHKVQLIASHGHTVFHAPQFGATAQLGNGATIAAITGTNTVSDLRGMDIALGGQGAPIVPMGEKLLFKNYTYYLNLGGIANISVNIEGSPGGYIAFDICPANRVLNMLAAKEGKRYDDGGSMTLNGTVNTALLTQLNNLEYYKKPYPKSLANDFGTDTLFPLIESFNLGTADCLRTFTEHIVQQIMYAVNSAQQPAKNGEMLITGGGAFNRFLIERLSAELKVFNIKVVIPATEIIQYKEALIMALLGVLRWREEDTVMHSVTGASRSSIGGAVWIGQEA